MLLLLLVVLLVCGVLLMLLASSSTSSTTTLLQLPKQGLPRRGWELSRCRDPHHLAVTAAAAANA
jgi:hypothetical protein